MVKPKVLPEPLDFMVSAVPLASKVAVPLQVAEIFCGEVTLTATVQVLAPVTVTEELYWSPQAVPGVTVAVQPRSPRSASWSARSSWDCSGSSCRRR